MSFTNDEISQIIEEFFKIVGARQYIGARYVPIFGRKGEDSITWDGGENAYEPLTIVLYQGNSYTSRQFVPIGVDISNEEFWANTGNYNGQIEEYRQAVVSFMSRTESIENALPISEFEGHTVKGYVDANVESINNDIENKYDTLSDAIDAQNATLIERMDERDGTIKAIIPFGEFSADDTVKDYIDGVETVLRNELVPFPKLSVNPKYGTAGQVLSTLTGGDTKWIDPVSPTDEQAAAAIDAWLDAHPDATTTVQDNSITNAKLVQSGGVLDNMSALLDAGTVSLAGGNSVHLEQGGMSATGMNAVSTTRIRTKEYIAVKPDTYYLVRAHTDLETTLGYSVSFYTANDYETARSSFNDFAYGNQYFKTPSDAKYIRVLINKAGNATIEPSDVRGFTIVCPSSLYTAQISSVDLNDMKQGGLYNIFGSVTNQPFANNTYTKLLECLAYANGCVMQRITYLDSGDKVYANSFIRFCNLNNIWSNWYLETPNVAIYDSAGTNFNLVTTPGNYLVIGNANIPNRPLSYGRATILQVLKASNGCVLQIMYDPLFSGGIYTRFLDVANVWHNWFGDFGGIKYSYPVVAKAQFNELMWRARTDTVLQDLLIYDGHFFDMYDSEMYVDGNSTPVSITCGHGNNAQFGTTLHGGFPYMYCPVWTRNVCEIYVNQVTTSAAQLVRTISFPTLSGYLNACVDEGNDRIYIMLCTSADTSDGEISFVVAELSTGTILSNDALSERYPIIQGMKFHNGHIYVLYGDNTASHPNTIAILSTSGVLESKTESITMYGEAEGIEFYNGSMYLANQTQIYKVS